MKTKQDLKDEIWSDKEIVAVLKEVLETNE